MNIKIELTAYDILRIEPILILNLTKYYDAKISYISETKKYIDKCRDYIN